LPEFGIAEVERARRAWEKKHVAKDAAEWTASGGLCFFVLYRLALARERRLAELKAERVLHH
jgi:hypothetical protein